MSSPAPRVLVEVVGFFFGDTGNTFVRQIRFPLALEWRIYPDLGANYLYQKRKRKVMYFPKVQRKNEFMIAAKFLTTRALNMEDVGRTCKQLWRSCDGFKMPNMTDHKVLFAFDDKRDVN